VKYLSLFSGIGGFELGIQKAFEGEKQKAICVGYSEIDKHAIKVYESQYPKHKNFGDITKIKASQLPDFDFLCGGFPCQAFSIAGKRKGFEDTRGTLFFDIARILRAKKPRRFLLENVKGLLNHNEGKTFSVIISTLEKLGYSVEWQVCNSKDFGVAQHRERVLIAGCRGKGSRSKVFPLAGSNTKAHKQDKIPKGSGIQSLFDSGYVNGRIVGLDGHSPAILTKKDVIPAIAITNSSSREFGWRKEYCPALCAGDSKNPKLVGYECLRCRKENKSVHGMYCRIRKLTPTECERLQGFPDGWTSGASDTQRYKMLGNAVTTNVIEAVIKKMFATKT
jgi:DNA (cytosine-5)-methyltransferase 1